MFASVLLLVSLGAGQADLATASAYDPRPGDVPAGVTGIDPWLQPTAEPWVDPSADGYWSDCVCQPGWDSCCCRRCCSWCSDCDFYPHYPYPAPFFGYYYFRPYNYVHIAQHQAQVARWGGDPRNPYSHEMFEKLYASLPVPAPAPFVPGQIRRTGGRPQLPDLESMLMKKVDAGPEFNAPVPPAPMP